MNYPDVAAGMAIITFVSAAVWFVVRMTTEPLKASVAELKSAQATYNTTPLGQKVHDLANTMQKHFDEDDKRFDEIKESIATGRKENNDHFAELRKALREETGEHRRSGAG